MGGSRAAKEDLLVTLGRVGRRLKAALPHVRIVLADPVGSALADWVETGHPAPTARTRSRASAAASRPRTSTAT